MDTESGNNDSSISGSISDEPRNSSKPVSPKHGDADTQGKFHGKQAGCVRKMSTMFEEDDDVSDDADPDVIRFRHQHQKRPEIETEWSSEEERGRLLSTVEREILVVPTHNGSNVRRIINSDDTPESVRRDKGHRRRPQPQLTVDQAESGSSSDRDNGPHSPGRLSARSIGPRHHRNCLNVRSLRAFSMDENYQHCPCCHQLSPTWASVLYTEANGSQARSFPDTVSIKSLASIGLGSSDGRKLTIRRVPTSPSELLNVIHPPP